MYNNFFGLKRLPFNITTDYQTIFESLSHKEALANLLYGIQERKGIILITGEVGTGKTTLCRVLLNRLPSQVKSSVIFNPYFSEVQLLEAIIEDFGLICRRKNRLDIVKSLNSFLLDIGLKRGNAVLIIDEAQDLSPRQLEQIRLLSNLETSEEKLLQIVLVGQPELTEKLNQSNLRQIRQRIVVKYNLSPLNREELKDYIEFRLNNAGAHDIEFLPECYEVIYEFSKGIPRLINILCDRALLLGYVRDKRVLGSEIFNTCVQEIR